MTPPSDARAARPKVWNKRDPNVPTDAVYVGRPTKWGNPFKIGQQIRDDEGNGFKVDRDMAIQLFKMNMLPLLVEDARRELRGKELVCWCAPAACHADVLLEIANQ